MKLFRQLCIILSICFLGDILSKKLVIPIPGSVIGMIILFIFLYTGVIKLCMLDEISKFLLDHLAFFFIPAGVGLISSIPIIKDKLLAIFIITFISTIIVTISTGLTVQLFKRRDSK